MLPRNNDKSLATSFDSIASAFPYDTHASRRVRGFWPIKLKERSLRFTESFANSDDD